MFGVIGIIMKAAPIGAFGAMAFTIGSYGPAALGNLVGLIVTFYLTAALFVVVVLGAHRPLRRLLDLPLPRATSRTSC